MGYGWGQRWELTRRQTLVHVVRGHPQPGSRAIFHEKTQAGWFCFILGIAAPITPRHFTPLPVPSGDKVQAGAPRARFIVKSTFTCLSRSPSGCCGTS